MTEDEKVLRARQVCSSETRGDLPVDGAFYGFMIIYWMGIYDLFTAITKRDFLDDWKALFHSIISRIRLANVIFRGHKNGSDDHAPPTNAKIPTITGKGPISVPWPGEKGSKNIDITKSHESHSLSSIASSNAA
ncbi:hypothetical protein HK102_003951 [Quaeritorhiza haematococci]|nr:hypothetical protein HK102_003951 [Quaeritorhiza haematococci]